MTFDAEFIVAAGFVLFVIGLAYLKVHQKVFGALDARAKVIADELTEAKRLREEAAAVLLSFSKKRAEAEAEAAAIVAQAQAEAQNLAKETEARMADFVTRRSQQAEAKIAQAEAQATADVRAAAADASIRAAEIVLRGNMTPSIADSLIEKGLAELKAKLH